MEKLLHERLREYAKDGVGIEADSPVAQMLKEYRLTPRLGNVYGEAAFLRKLADEIERCYIPRPRFDDGEPVQFGDEAQVRDDLGEVCKMVFTAGGCEEVMIGFEYDSSASHYMVVDGEFVKRPAPKVLDADGVEIKVGDTVYCITDGDEVIVSEIYRGVTGDMCFYGVGRGHIGFIANGHTHERPVFDADGERIKVGDTVYSLLKDGEEPFGTCYVVTAIDTSREMPVSCGHWGEREWLFKGTSLTHREPDSLEKLRDDLMAAYEDWEGDPNDLVGYTDRLTALIERGA